MVLSIVIPALPGPDEKRAEILASTLLGVKEIIIEAGGQSAGEARNLGFSKTTGSEILFLDCDVILPEGLELSDLVDYNFQVATAYSDSLQEDYTTRTFVTWQNLQLALGLPGSFYGSLMYFSRSAFEKLGGFRTYWNEDIEIAQRAFLSGYTISAFPFRYYHSRETHSHTWPSIQEVTRPGELYGIPNQWQEIFS